MGQRALDGWVATVAFPTCVDCLCESQASAAQRAMHRASPYAALSLVEGSAGSAGSAELAHVAQRRENLAKVLDVEEVRGEPNPRNVRMWEKKTV